MLNFSNLLSFFVQIYVEVPRARLTLELAKVMEKEGNLKKAAFVLQELQVRMYICTLHLCTMATAGINCTLCITCIARVFVGGNVWFNGT